MPVQNYLNTERPLPDILRWLWKRAGGNRLQTSLNALLGVLQVVMSLTSVYAVKYAIDIASHARSGNLYVAVAGMGGIILAEFMLGVAGTWVANILGVRARNRMQRQMLERVLRSEWQGKGTYHSGDILNRLEGDVNAVVVFLTETIPGVLSTLLMFTGAFLYLYSMDRTLALVTIAIVPVCVLMSRVYVSRMRRLNRKVRDSDSEIQSVMQETVQQMMVIKTLESGRAMLDKLSSSHAGLRRNVVKRTWFSLFSNLTISIGFAVSYLVAFGWSAVRLSEGTLTFGGMTAFLRLVSKIQSPARSLARVVPQFVAVLTAAERLMDLEDVPEEKEGNPVHVPAPCSLKFENVTFRYEPGSRYIFRNFTCTFRPGTATAVVGETGAGKTTLIRLLLSLVRPSEGRVLIGEDGQEITHLHRCNFVYVPQGNTLMSGTVRENLLLGKPDATEAELYDVLRKSCGEFVLELPDGLDTVCSEQGGGFSEGQAQRIAVARALLRDRPVMVFDEATSALDTETERRLLENILAGHDRTVIFITHRMAVCDYCDDVLRL
ncbi:MAG: ABC transporter ATP-binding protein/permease [Bacteroidales bacterium]|nr:ABC transporter ATP-binding protein/permease [Bacteroidales bacterium]MCM1147176.1 ABC transporter ATP-binding protein/permease [Bacteroidales bacterium]MCM1205402.1 ABC transporter ATP-binding protein/permease [Bacillota bacterium]MCM1509793.1 ABC transporter ATP-binding protein/permease [Clostridium sp.]